MNPAYRVTIAVESNLEPDEIQRIALSALQGVIGDVARVTVALPLNKHCPQVQREGAGVIEWKEVERPVESPADLEDKS